MAGSVNKVILIGRLGKDPEIRYTQTGLAVATLNLATNSPSKNRETGEWEEVTEWHRVVFFERPAEVAEQYLRKGSQIYVEGRLRTQKWQDRDGNDRWTTEIVGRDLQMLGSRGDSDSSQYTPSASRSAAPSTPASPPSQNAPDNSAPAPRSNKPALPDDFEDDIPF